LDVAATQHQQAIVRRAFEPSAVIKLHQVMIEALGLDLLSSTSEPLPIEVGFGQDHPAQMVGANRCPDRGAQLRSRRRRDVEQDADILVPRVELIGLLVRRGRKDADRKFCRPFHDLR